MSHEINEKTQIKLFSMLNLLAIQNGFFDTD